MKPELVRFTDGAYVIVGDHLTLEEVREQFGKEYDEYTYDYDDINQKDIFTPIDTVKHWWVRYEFIGPDNCPDDWDDVEHGDSTWILRAQEKRPKGVVRKATVINE